MGVLSAPKLGWKIPNSLPVERGLPKGTQSTHLSRELETGMHTESRKGVREGTPQILAYWEASPNWATHGQEAACRIWY